MTQPLRLRVGDRVRVAMPERDDLNGLHGMVVLIEKYPSGALDDWDHCIFLPAVYRTKKHSHLCVIRFRRRELRKLPRRGVRDGSWADVWWKGRSDHRHYGWSKRMNTRALSKVEPARERRI